MARVVLVHGAFNELWGPNELKARWLPAVRDGLWHHGVEVVADDVDVCFYGDLFRHHPGSDEDRQLEQSRAGVAEALSGLRAATRWPRWPGGRRGGLRPHRRHGHDHDDRARPARTAAARGSKPRSRADTRVLVAHSLGTCPVLRGAGQSPASGPSTRSSPSGSPLAARMVFDMLEPAPVDGQAPWPGSVAALGERAGDERQGLRVLAGRERFGPRVEEFVIDNGHRAHAPEPYLNAAATGAAIAAALATDPAT